MKPIKIEIEIQSEENAVVTIDGRKFAVNKIYINSIEDAEEKNVPLYSFETRSLSPSATGSGYTDAEFTFGGIWLGVYNGMLAKTLDAVGYLSSVAPNYSAWSELDESSKFIIESTLSDEDDEDGFSENLLRKHNEKTN
jgi:hypothetical protein